MYNRILLPIGASHDLNVAAAKHALSLADPLDAKVYIMHVLDSRKKQREYEKGTIPSDVIEKMKDAVAGLDAGDNVQYLTQWGDPAKTICRIVNELDCDLIVMPTHGRTGLSRVTIGSVTEETVRKASVPVVTMTQETNGPPEIGTSD